MKSSRNCSGGWKGLVGGFSYYIKYFIKYISFKHIKYISWKYTFEKGENLQVRSTDKYFCQFGFIHCQFFRGRRQGRQPLNNYSAVLLSGVCRKTAERLRMDLSRQLNEQGGIQIYKRFIVPGASRGFSLEDLKVLATKVPTEKATWQMQIPQLWTRRAKQSCEQLDWEMKNQNT